MDVLKLAKKRLVTMRLISRQLWPLPTHWSPLLKRTLLCPAVMTCPRCALERPKQRGYAIAQVALQADRKDEGLAELCQEVIDQLIDRGMDPTRAAGWTFRMERRDERPGWKLLGASQSETVVNCEDDELPAALEKLYGLPPVLRPNGSELHSVILTDLREWQAEQVNCLTRRLEADLQHERSRA